MSEHSYERRWWMFGVLCLSLVMIVVANASLNVALPTLVNDLHASTSSLQWIVDAYALVFAGLLLTAGALGDRYGRRLAFNGGLLVFGAASALATMASSPGQLIAARAAMGVGAAFVMPATLSVLAHVFPPEERRRAIAIWVGFAGVGVALGGVTSGWLLEHFWWGSIFVSNVIVVVIALVASAVLIPPSRDAHAPAIDPIGAVLSIAGVGSLVYAIIEAPVHGWVTVDTAIAFVVALVFLLSFALWELRADEPMLDLRLFRNPRFTAATSSITLMFLIAFGMIFVLTQYLQLVLGYGPLEAGIQMLPWALVYMVAAPISARFVERWGQRRVVSSGMAIVAAGMFLLSRSGLRANYPLLAVALVVAALGQGLVSAPSTGAIMVSLPLNKAGVGSAVNDTTRELGGALGVAVLGSILSSLFRHHVGGAYGSIGDAFAAASEPGMTPAAAGMLRGLAREAYVNALSGTMLVVAAVAIGASALVAWMLRPRAGEQTAPAEGAPALEPT